MAVPPGSGAAPPVAHAMVHFLRRSQAKDRPAGALAATAARTLGWCCVSCGVVPAGWARSLFVTLIFGGRTPRGGAASWLLWAVSVSGVG